MGGWCWGSFWVFWDVSWVVGVRDGCFGGPFRGGASGTPRGRHGIWGFARAGHTGHLVRHPTRCGRSTCQSSRSGVRGAQATPITREATNSLFNLNFITLYYSFNLFSCSLDCVHTYVRRGLKRVEKGPQNPPQKHPKKPGFSGFKRALGTLKRVFSGVFSGVRFGVLDGVCRNAEKSSFQADFRNPGFCPGIWETPKTGVCRKHAKS